MSQVKLVKNYLTNVDEIITLAEKHRDKFSSRTNNDTHNFKTTYGNSKLKSLFYFNMDDELKAAITKTIPDDPRFITSMTINRYDPGDYLLRHKDSIGGYWKFKLIFLQSENPHFKYFDDSGTEHIVEEEPGAYVDMPIHFEHEVTEIGLNEQSKYSLVLAWGRIG
jgi:hypothetical protein